MLHDAGLTQLPTRAIHALDQLARGETLLGRQDDTFTAEGRASRPNGPVSISKTGR